MTAPCFICRIEPAGNPTYPNSAYCATCQPTDANPVPPGTRASQCAGCGLNFTSQSAFDKHQDQAGGWTVCHDPTNRGLVAVTRDSIGRTWKMWGWPGNEDGRSWLRDSDLTGEQPVAGVSGRRDAQIPAPAGSGAAS